MLFLTQHNSAAGHWRTHFRRVRKGSARCLLRTSQSRLHRLAMTPNHHSRHSRNNHQLQEVPLRVPGQQLLPDHQLQPHLAGQLRQVEHGRRFRLQQDVGQYVRVCWCLGAPRAASVSSPAWPTQCGLRVHHCIRAEGVVRPVLGHQDVRTEVKEEITN